MRKKREYATRGTSRSPSSPQTGNQKPNGRQYSWERENNPGADWREERYGYGRGPGLGDLPSHADRRYGSSYEEGRDASFYGDRDRYSDPKGGSNRDDLDSELKLCPECRRNWIDEGEPDYNENASLEEKMNASQEEYSKQRRGEDAPLERKQKKKKRG